MSGSCWLTGRPGSNAAVLGGIEGTATTVADGTIDPRFTIHVLKLQTKEGGGNARRTFDQLSDAVGYRQPRGNLKRVDKVKCLRDNNIPAKEQQHRESDRELAENSAEQRTTQACDRL